MKYGLKRPCAECPFRATSLRGFLGPDTGNPAAFINPIAGRVEIAPGAFIGTEPADQACHMDMERVMEAQGVDDASEISPDLFQHCAGALHFLALDCKLPHDREKIDAMHRVERANQGTEMLGSVREFIAHHTLGEPKPKRRKAHV